MKYRYLFVLFSALALNTFSTGQVIDASLSKGSVLGPGDEITGKVVGESEYDFTAFVNENGYVEVPFSSEPVLAKCKTERELRVDLTERLSKYLKNPQFSFRVVNRNSRPPTTVSGEVNNPQQFVLMRKVTLFELINFAGGPKEDSAGGIVQVFRPQAPMCTGGNDDSHWLVGDTNPVRTPYRSYNLKDISIGGEESNPVIYPGDLVSVQRAAPIWVTGEVISAQGIFLKEEGLSVMGAIAKVGGPRREAKLDDVRVHRLKPGTKDDYETIAVNLKLVKKGLQKDLMLKPFDIVEVGIAKESVAKQILGFAIGAAKSGVMSGFNAGAYKVIY
jgi:polysaccharide biosynthesis/export protein